MHLQGKQPSPHERQPNKGGRGRLGGRIGLHEYQLGLGERHWGEGYVARWRPSLKIRVGGSNECSGRIHCILPPSPRFTYLQCYFCCSLQAPPRRLGRRPATDLIDALLQGQRVMLYLIEAAVNPAGTGVYVAGERSISTTSKSIAMQDPEVAPS